MSGGLRSIETGTNVRELNARERGREWERKVTRYFHDSEHFNYDKIS